MQRFSTQRKAIAIISLLFIAAVLAVVASRSQVGDSRAPDGMLSVAASIFPVYDIVRTIGGEYVYTQLLLPPGNRPDADVFSPDMVEEDTDIIFLIGHELDDDVISEDNQNSVVFLDRNIDLLLDQGSTASPYYWLSIRNAAFMVNTITTELSAKDPSHAEYYQSNAARLLSEFEQVDKAIAVLFDETPFNHVAIYGFDWGYFARDYNLQIVEHVSPVRAVDADSPVLTLRNAVNEYGLRAIFSDILLDPSPILPVATVESRPFSILYLDTLGGVEERTSYARLMAANARTFFDGLQAGAPQP